MPRNEINYEDSCWDQFKNEIDGLRDEREEIRLYSLAKIEARCYCSGGLTPTLINLIIEVIKTDKSPIVRAFAMRTLYHPRSEQWPIGSEVEKFTDAIECLRSGSQTGSGPRIDRMISQDLRNIDKEINWFDMEYQDLRAENRRLREENARLKELCAREGNVNGNPLANLEFARTHRHAGDGAVSLINMKKAPKKE